MIPHPDNQNVPKEERHAQGSSAGKAFLLYAFEEIDSRWGSVEAYLDKEIGVSPVDIAALRTTYLE